MSHASPLIEQDILAYLKQQERTKNCCALLPVAALMMAKVP